MRTTAPVVITVWGDFACWTKPECKVERLSYPVPTPSGIRGLLASIYSKPAEFYWQVKEIEVLKPIRFITFKRNEVKGKLSYNKSNPAKSCICIEDDRTQRQSVVLQDVCYRITAEMVLRPEFGGTPQQLFNQFERRVKRGQNFVQPSMGTREFPAYYEWGTTGESPIDENMDLGLMLYDVFDLNEWKVGKKANPSVSLYRAKMEKGVIQVPPYDSELVLKPGKVVRKC
ncbi:MAG: type I-C CRISPR-associated protein Cas5c [Lachnospiraceae bacterium]|nr:type I-C CRISPR-associated protein Cas5c [Lachnospiraceae bacterium]